MGIDQEDRSTATHDELIEFVFVAFRQGLIYASDNQRRDAIINSFPILQTHSGEIILSLCVFIQKLAELLMVLRVDIEFAMPCQKSYCLSLFGRNLENRRSKLVLPN